MCSSKSKNSQNSIYQIILKIGFGLSITYLVRIWIGLKIQKIGLSNNLNVIVAQSKALRKSENSKNSENSEFHRCKIRNNSIAKIWN